MDWETREKRIQAEQKLSVSADTVRVLVASQFPEYRDLSGFLVSLQPVDTAGAPLSGLHSTRWMKRSGH